MIIGPHDVLPVRLAASASGNALRRHVRRISVGGVLLCSLWLAVSVAFSADANKEEWTIRIVPATKARSAPPFPRFAPPAPMMNQMNRGRMPQPPAKVPPPPAAEPPASTPQPRSPQSGSPQSGSPQSGSPQSQTPQSQKPQAHASKARTQQPRIIPASRAHSAPNVVRFQHIYRSIPYSRAAYEYDPMYRQELALSLLLNQFPPAPTIMAPGSSNTGTQGPRSPYRGGRRFGSPMNYGPPMSMPGFVPEF
jgi:hypothetical protein